MVACENSRPSSLPARVAFREEDVSRNVTRGGSEEGRLFSQANGLANRSVFPDQIGIWKLLVFVERGKTKTPRKTLGARSKNNKQQNTRPHMANAKLGHIEVPFSQLSSHFVQCT